MLAPHFRSTISSQTQFSDPSSVTTTTGRHANQRCHSDRECSRRACLRLRVGHFIPTAPQDPLDTPKIRLDRMRNKLGFPPLSENSSCDNAQSCGDVRFSWSGELGVTAQPRSTQLDARSTRDPGKGSRSILIRSGRLAPVVGAGTAAWPVPTSVSEPR